mmetsp:Transcript_6042/g.14446  ORF Transcript_6042/g.14446 Transcript_6042/m.14446 type:complete len:260 (+) Transcript_6042:838-1617(+)
MSGFLCSWSICDLNWLGSMPGGNGVLLIIFCKSSEESLDMASVACFSMSGFSASRSAALAQLLESPLPPPAAAFVSAGALVLLLLARLPLEVEGVAASRGGCCHSARTQCVCGSASSERPCSFNWPRKRSSSAAMALSAGESSAARRTSATASPRLPSSARACPRRKSALKLLGSALRASSLASSAPWKSFVFKWQSAELLSSTTFKATTSSPTWPAKFSRALVYLVSASAYFSLFTSLLPSFLRISDALYMYCFCADI